MAIISEKIDGKIIKVEINSTNLKYAEYDTEEETLKITFTNGSIYEYNKVPWAQFTKFRLSESQGMFFNSSIAKNYVYKRLDEKKKSI